MPPDYLELYVVDAERQPVARSGCSDPDAWLLDETEYPPRLVEPRTIH